MFYLAVILVVGGIAYLTQNKRDRKLPTWMKVVFWILVIAALAEISEKASGFVFLVILVWWLVRRPSRKKKRLAAAHIEPDLADFMAKSTSRPVDPIERYVSTPNRQKALAELNSNSQELTIYIKQEIDTFFMNEWTKMAVIYEDRSNQFDDDVQENAGRQMREILDAIMAKFAKQKRAEMVEKQAINEELKAKHKEEIDIAMQVYDKWQDKA